MDSRQFSYIPQFPRGPEVKKKWLLILIAVVPVFTQALQTDSTASPVQSVVPDAATTNPTASFFGIHAQPRVFPGNPWPESFISFASWRTQGAGVKWSDINTAENTYDWSILDQGIAETKAAGQDVMFTLFSTPIWASSRGSHCIAAGNPAGCLGPPNTDCFVYQNGAGNCDPPDDLNCDGSGTDQHFKTFVSALLNHVGAGKIKYWELWNEPNMKREWNAEADCPNTPNAPYLILARMAADLREIVAPVDSEAKFTTPAPAGGRKMVPAWLEGYLANSNGANYADIIAFHGYIVEGGTCPNACPVAEKVVELVSNVRNVASTYGQQSKPLFDTEASWGNVNGVDAMTDPDQQTAFVGRFYLLQMGAGVAKFYWFAWNFPTTGILYDAKTTSLNSSGVAYKEIAKWTSGATVEPCSANGNVWSCVIAGPSGSESEAIWDASQTCKAGVCSTKNVSVPSKFTSYLDLAGEKHAIENDTVPVGLKPVLLTTD
jgi:hypothetical protein